MSVYEAWGGPLDGQMLALPPGASVIEVACATLTGNPWSDEVVPTEPIRIRRGHYTLNWIARAPWSRLVWTEPSP